MVIGLFASQAGGQMISPDPIDSIDALVATSKAISIGTVTRSTIEERKVQRTFTFTVRETLRGEPAAQISGTARIQRFRPKVTEAPADRFLIFSGRENNDLRAIDLDSPDLSVSTADFRWISSPETVLSKVRKLLKDPPVEAMAIPPPENQRGQDWTKAAEGYGGNRLMVPIDDRFQGLAFEYAHTRDISRAFYAIEMLQKLKSDANIAKLKKLLGDSTYIVRLKAEDWNGEEIRAYIPRLVATEVLKRWKVHFDPVVTDERISKIDTIRSLKMTVNYEDPAMNQLAKGKNLQTLNIMYGAMSTEQVRIIGTLTQLKDLAITRVTLDDAKFKQLLGLKKLQKLNIDYNPVSDETLKELAHFSDLREVSLFHTHATEAGIAALRKACPNLKVVTEKEEYLPYSDPGGRQVPMN